MSGMPSVERLKALLTLMDQARFEYAQAQTLGVRKLDIDLAAVTTTQPKTENVRGYGLIFPSFGQTAGAALQVAIDGVPIPFMPGARVMSAFQRIEVFNTANGANVGAASLFIITRPDVWLELGELGTGNLQAVQYTQLYNSAVNVPTLAAQGVSLAGGKGVRAVVIADGVTTISANSLGVWWLYDDLSSKWAESAVQVDLSRTTARNAVSVPDEFTTVARGRAFLEVRNGTNSGGAGAFTVDLFAN